MYLCKKCGFTFHGESNYQERIVRDQHRAHFVKVGATYKRQCPRAVVYDPTGMKRKILIVREQLQGAYNAN